MVRRDTRGWSKARVRLNKESIGELFGETIDVVTKQCDPSVCHRVGCVHAMLVHSVFGTFDSLSLSSAIPNAKWTIDCIGLSPR